jgi:hypothetical protein
VNVDIYYLRTGCGGEYFGLREMKYQENGEKCIIKSFIICSSVNVGTIKLRNM